MSPGPSRTDCSLGTRQTFLGKAATDRSQTLWSSKAAHNRLHREGQGKCHVECHAAGTCQLQELEKFLGIATGAKMLIRNLTTGLICEC